MESKEKKIRMTLWDLKAEDEEVKVGVVVVVVRGFKVMLIEGEGKIVALLRCCKYIPTPGILKPKLVSDEVWALVLDLLKWGKANVFPGAIFPLVENIKSRASQSYPQAMTYYLANFPKFNQTQVASHFNCSLQGFSEYLHYFNIFSRQKFAELKESANEYYKSHDEKMELVNWKFGMKHKTLAKYRCEIGDTVWRHETSVLLDSIPTTLETKRINLKEVSAKYNVNERTLGMRRNRSGAAREERENRQRVENDAALYYTKT